ncbi:hypothetical protein NEOLEDRAFT_723192 [Neolentinus lepideus HHB14362 ss-1]|uniref:F-box domain-containing protein n=1 Tax=Neolentinus lepideus HHB14362 ss-1 TaxID=1314782 RepID=A0A165Q354_9AGAM|nr:hypothetical protein NEOLEDRAFT_723192 [Neolentinus lepideus HHB14362 ss-1]
MTTRTSSLRFPVKLWTPGEDLWPAPQSDPVKADAVELRNHTETKTREAGQLFGLSPRTNKTPRDWPYLVSKELGTNLCRAERKIKRTNGPSLFVNLPNELYVEIFKWLEPIEVLSISKVSRQFKRMISDDPANVILRTVRDAWGAPRAPVEMSERCWINILFGRKCQICGQSAGGCSPITSAVLGRRSGRSFDIMSLVLWGDWTI